MRFRPAVFAAALLALGTAWLGATPSLASNTKPFNLSDIVRRSDQIVSGTVSDVAQGVDEHGLPYTQVELEVARSIRGQAEGTMTFRQLGLQRPQPAANGRMLLGAMAGMPRYEKGEQVLLFLTKPSRLGFRTTVGLEQGRFTLRGGNLENGVNNAGLFRNVDLSKTTLSAKERFLTTTQQGAINADTFTGFVQRAVAQNWWGLAGVTPPPENPGPSVPTNPQVPGKTGVKVIQVAAPVVD